MKSARPLRYARALIVDESQFVVANPAKQHYSVFPETVYFPMQLRCERCAALFWFTAGEQRVWYEEWGFWIDSIPLDCAECRRVRREEQG